MARFALFCHSLRSDWNHGNAHFLRGIVSELRRRNFAVDVFEPESGWSARNLAADLGPAALDAWRAVYPDLAITTYDPSAFDVALAVDNADVVIVHEWTDPTVVARLAARRRGGAAHLLLFHDTHHRMVSAPEEMARLDLDGFDGVLAFGETLSDAYRRRGWGRQVFTWHEAADLRVFRPQPGSRIERDLVWIGNWGDDERAAELREFLIEPVAALGLSVRVHGVRYPEEARTALAQAGIDYTGYLPNFAAPEAFAKARMTVHVPRRPYARMLPGIPTIRMFEALACGIPLVSAPCDDCEHLFTPGEDYLVARDGAEMRHRLAALRDDPGLRAELAEHGRATIAARHSCAHRIDELLAICAALGRILNPATIDAL
ncbi:MAG TPA: glycosyltransferase [Stellaceae bacterium]|jgi:spore maturation protein CgeB|nr:glycosyltransferase [Stellaceae bacterium]